MHRGPEPDFKGKDALVALVFTNATACIRKSLFGHADGAQYGQKCTDAPGRNALCSRCMHNQTLPAMSMRIVSPPVFAASFQGQKKGPKPPSPQQQRTPITPSRKRASTAVSSQRRMPPPQQQATASSSRQAANPFAAGQQESMERRMSRMAAVANADPYQPLRTACQFFRGVCPLCAIMEPHRRDIPKHRAIGDCPHVKQGRFGSAKNWWAKKGGFVDLPGNHGPMLCYLCWLPATPDMPHPDVTETGPDKCMGDKNFKHAVLFLAWNDGTRPGSGEERVTAFRRDFPDAPLMEDTAEGASAMIEWLMTDAPDSKKRKHINYLEVLIHIHREATRDL